MVVSGAPAGARRVRTEAAALLLREPRATPSRHRHNHPCNTLQPAEVTTTLARANKRAKHTMAAQYTRMGGGVAPAEPPRRCCRLSGPCQGLLIAGVIVVAVVVGVLVTALHKTAPASQASAADVALAVLPGSRVFLGIGDWGREGTNGQTATGATMGNWAAAIETQSGSYPHVLNVGDSFYDNGVASAADPQWVTSFSGIYSQPALQASKWYAVAGNRDYRGNLSAQINWDGEAATTGVDRWRFPALYYAKTWSLPASSAAALTAPAAPARDNGDGAASAATAAAAAACVSVVFLDTSPYLPGYWTNPDTPQMLVNLQASNITAENAWLAQQLQAGAGACVAQLVVGHHPLYSGGHQGNTPQLIAAWEPLLQQYADAYIAGHGERQWWTPG